ncbi:HAMP domain-containing protein [Pantoea sp. Tr-811]|uniref:ATP-binding protein n=1 Tax=Pantoea sp. Tr-811 TaxID=2608361 RepID=UPI00141ED413|nr:ATP-binding protein [Pantoea sp. Tr-811]NIF28919.1 HAMP domain-containing protein [Pantoea sp. Tr-811]
MTLLAVSAVVAITGCMFLYFWISDYLVQASMNAADHARFVVALGDVERNEPLLWQMLQRYYDINDFLPGFSSGNDWLAFYSFIIIVIPMIIIAGLMLSRPLSRQFREIAHAAGKVASGDLNTRVSHHPSQPAEMQLLCVHFNKMVERLGLYQNEVAESGSNLAHELRTPLNAALGRIQGMLDDVFPLCPEQLCLVQAQLNNLNSLVGDLHLLSLAHAGQLPLHVSPFTLVELIEERVAWFLPQLEAVGMAVSVHCARELTVEADKGRLGQLINILVENAIKYAADGRTLRIAARTDFSNLYIDFLDRGQAIEHKDLDNMFARFWRAEQSRARVSGGGGLGLSIAQAICDAHGGSIEAQRRDEGGLVLRITLPIILEAT